MDSETATNIVDDIRVAMMQSLSDVITKHEHNTPLNIIVSAFMASADHTWEILLDGKNADQTKHIYLLRNFYLHVFADRLSAAEIIAEELFELRRS